MRDKLIFATAGLVIGFFIGNVTAKAKFNKELKEQIDSLTRVYKNRKANKEKKEEKKEDVKTESEVKKEDERIETLKRASDKAMEKYTTDLLMIDGNEVEPIPQEEYGEREGFECASFDYNTWNSTMTNDVMEEVDANDALKKYIENSKDTDIDMNTLYFRDVGNKIDYEIVKMYYEGDSGGDINDVS